MGTFKSREDYLKALCIAHPQVAHTSVVDGVTRNSFFRLNNEWEISAATLQTITYPAVAFFHIEGRITDMDSALVDIRHVFKNAWMFITHVDNFKEGDEGVTDRIQAAFDETFAIMEDFIRAMKDDYELNGHCGAFEYIDLNKMNYVQVGPVLQEEFGWILYFENEIKARNILDGDVIPVDPDFCNNFADIIPINNESFKSITWTAVRQDKFGSFPHVEVWLSDPLHGAYYKAAVQPTIDAPPPAFTTMYFNFSGNVTGYIVLK